MNNGFVKFILGHPFLLAMAKLVITIGEVIVHFVAMQDFQSMKQKDINDHLRHNYDDREHQIVVKISLSYTVTLWNSCLV